MKEIITNTGMAGTIHPMSANPEQHRVVQLNPLIEARYKLDLLPQQLMRVLVSMIKPSCVSFENEYYQIDIAEFGKLIGREGEMAGSIYTELLVAARKLLTRLVVIKSGRATVETQWLSGCRHVPGSGTMEFKFPPDLFPYLVQLKQRFTQYQLINVCKLKSQYSIRLYELLKQYIGLGKRTMFLNELKNIVGVEKKYQLYNDVRRYILNPVHHDITTKTDLVYHWRPIKTGRKVTAIEFYDIAAKETDTGIEKPKDESAIREAMERVDALIGKLGGRLESPYTNVREKD